jgi:DNA-binding response OmpR family regulator
MALAGQRFLVVEDDPAVTLLLEAALESRGADVCIVRSHAELDGALSEPHDGAIVDLSPLEGHVSEAFAKVAAAARAGAPLVLATGSVDALPEEVTRLSVAVRLVRKPFELGEVLAALTSGKGQNPGQL